MALEDMLKNQKDYIATMRCYEEMKTVVDKITVIGAVLYNNKFFEDEKNKDFQKTLTMALSFAKEAEIYLNKMELEKVQALLLEMMKNAQAKPNE